MPPRTPIDHRAYDPDPDPDRALALSRLEAATGLALGQDGSAGPDLSPAVAGERSTRSKRDAPRAALAGAMLRALRRGPCWVSFSGGRDSSAVLAVATDAARRAGLDDPIPVTLRFDGVASTDESRWQELVVRHLGLRSWEIIQIGDDLDLLGPIARTVLRRHGLLWPPNAHLHVPILARARGARLMTGFDGDGLLGDWRWARAQAVLHGRRPIGWRDPARVALAALPARARTRLRPPALAGAAPWLAAAAQRDLAAHARRHAAAEPRRWDRRLAFYARHRYIRLTTHSLDVLGRAAGVEVLHPLIDAGFLAALGRTGGAAGYGDRTSAMRILFGDLLPPTLTGRRGKAEFGRALWRTETRAFADGWTGQGVDAELVDADALRDAWSAPSPRFGSSTLLQIAWLAGQPK
jgi:asparagine synthase (glutamine-hydrolysing)